MPGTVNLPVGIPTGLTKIGKRVADEDGRPLAVVPGVLDTKVASGSFHASTGHAGLVLATRIARPGSMERVPFSGGSGGSGSVTRCEGVRSALP